MTAESNLPTRNRKDTLSMHAPPAEPRFSHRSDRRLLPGSSHATYCLFAEGSGVRPDSSANRRALRRRPGLPVPDRSRYGEGGVSAR